MSEPEGLSKKVFLALKTVRAGREWSILGAD